MGNETSLDIHEEDAIESFDKDGSENTDDKEEKPKSLQWRQSHHYVSNFTNKWLSKVSLRPIVVTNKLHGLNKTMDGQEIHQFISRFDDMMIHHSGIEITLNEDGYFDEPEVYVVFPDYGEMVSDLCVKRQKEQSIDIQMELAWILPETAKVDTTESRIYDIFGRNYGFIDDVCFEDKCNSEIEDVPFIHVTKKGIYDKLLFENREFLTRSILPVELLRIICDEYIGDTENEGIRGLSIWPPDINETLYEWRCHKMMHIDSKQETITFHTGINLFGKYFNLTTEVHIGSHYDCSLRKMSMLKYCKVFGSEPVNRIIGTIY